MTPDKPLIGTVEAKRRRNASLAVVSLAPELLIKIFKFYKASWMEGTDKKLLPVQDPMAELARLFGGRQAPQFLPTHGWTVALTHVCHRWREVAIQESALWSDLTLDTFRGLPTFIERASHAAALSVRGYMYKTGAQVLQEHWAHVFRLSSRISHLSIEFGKGDEVRFKDIPDAGFPGLSRLRLSSQEGCDTDLPAFVRRQASFPSLETLHTTFFAFPSVAPLFSAHLCVVDVTCAHPRPRITPKQGFSWSIVLGALRELRCVGLLSLANVFPPLPADDRQLRKQDPVFLPHLAVIRLQDHGSACAALLNLLSFPSDTKVFLYLTEDGLVRIPLEQALQLGNGSANADIPGVVSLLAERFEGSASHPPVPPVRELWMGCPEDPEDLDAVTICGWSNLSPRALPPLSEWPMLLPDLHILSSSYEFPVFVERLTPLSTFRGVERLVVATDGWRIQDRNWVKISRDMQHVRELVVQGSCVGTFAAAIASVATGTAQLFPALKTLTLCGIHMRERMQDPSSRYFHQQWLPVFARSLANRAHRGLALEKLVIEDAYDFTARHLQFLHASLVRPGAVGAVQWDGVVQEWVEEDFMAAMERGLFNY